MDNIVEIKLSKTKIILLLIAGIVFVIFGFLGAIRPDDFVSALFRNPEVIRISAILGVCFFGIGIVFLLQKVFDNKPGLIIDQNGITNNSMI